MLDNRDKFKRDIEICLNLSSHTSNFFLFNVTLFITSDGHSVENHCNSSSNKCPCHTNHQNVFDTKPLTTHTVLQIQTTCIVQHTNVLSIDILCFIR